jgi:hypothetical protein
MLFWSLTLVYHPRILPTGVGMRHYCNLFCFLFCALSSLVFCLFAICTWCLILCFIVASCVFHFVFLMLLMFFLKCYLITVYFTHFVPFLYLALGMLIRNTNILLIRVIIITIIIITIIIIKSFYTNINTIQSQIYWFMFILYSAVNVQFIFGHLHRLWWA